MLPWGILYTLCMAKPLLSVVIPTHKRAGLLRQCLEYLEKQTIAKELEVIVVSDGHDPDTATLFEDTTHYKLLTTHFIEIPKSQQGIARNRGVERAKAERILFIGDDIFLASDACAKHITACATATPSSPLQKDRTAILGFTTWDPSLAITPVMKWLEETGWQFGYPLLEPYRHAVIPKEMQHRFTYTSHISLPTEIAKKIPFREDVSLYGWEDIEWGMRLRDAGVSLFYEPDARAWHHHPLTLEDSLKRMEILGRSAVHLKKIAPQLDRLPHGWKHIAYQVLALLPTLRGQHARAFLRGIADAGRV